MVTFLTEVTRSHGGPPVTRETGGPWEVTLDKRRAERIMSNLFENADRYAHGVTYLGLSRTPDRLRVTVDDSGPGVPEADRDRVFERFWRGATARRDAASGTGLGLSLVAEHLRLLGGGVQLETAPSGGARFVVDLPAAEWAS